MAVDSFEVQLLKNFLQGNSTMGTGSSTSQIVDILTTIGEQIQKDLEKVTTEEEMSAGQFAQLIPAYQKAIQASADAIDEKQVECKAVFAEWAVEEQNIFKFWT